MEAWPGHFGLSKILSFTRNDAGHERCASRFRVHIDDYIDLRTFMQGSKGAPLVRGRLSSAMASYGKCSEELSESGVLSFSKLTSAVRHETQQSHGRSIQM